MATQSTSNLIIVNGMPAADKLWNGRWRLEFFCDPSNKNEGWYNENIDGWIPEFGALQDHAIQNGWEYPNEDVAYDDMRLVEAETQFVPQAGTHYIRLAYETLTASWVAEKDEDIDYELNGLTRVTRTFVALPETAYEKVVGTDTIEVDGTTLFLGSANIKKTDAKWELTEVWLEAGELSRSENLEDGRESITITTIGACPSAPEGYTAVDKKEDNNQGFPTCTITFYKDDSVLSRSNDYVGSQLAEVIEVFNPTSEPTPTNGGILGRQDVSNVDGIPTTRYTFLVPSILSKSEDLIGSQLAIVIETFNEVPDTPTDYTLAKKDTSDFEGIPTRRYTFLKPSTLTDSTDTKFNGALLIRTKEEFNQTPSTPAGYTLTSETTSNVDGVPTRRYSFAKGEGVISTSTSSAGPNLPRLNRVTIRSFGTAVASTGFLVESDDIERDGYIEYVRTSLDGVVDTFSYQTTVPFTIPGTVDTDVIDLSGGVDNLTLDVTPPIPTPCDATVTTTYSTDSTIDTSVIWRPIEWASSTVSGLGWGFRPISNVDTYINHIRLGSGDTITGSVVGSPQCCMGVNVYGGLDARIKLEGPTEDPAGTVITLSISNDEAFVTADGTQYYKKVEVTVSVPSRP